MHNGDVTVTTTDGYLPAALDRLYAAVAGLIDPLKEVHDGAVMAAPSLYQQLLGAIPTTMGHATVQTGRRSMPPVWTDALDSRVEIDDKTREWQPSLPGRHHARQIAPGGRQAVATTRHTSDVEKIAGNVESWAVSVKSLLSPAAVKQLSAPCPACGATTAFRRDSAGERVRVPALQIR